MTGKTIDSDKETVLRGLRSIPGIGKSIAGDLWDLGIRDPGQLAGRSPQELYDELCCQRGVRLDRCLLYVFRCAVYYASTELPEPELLKWWNWKDRPSL
ncbi:MAG: helix-hairpin-helix domain-containing protein [Syntrophomonas sp.]